MCKVLAALCQDTQSGMRLASAWLSRLLLRLAMDAKAHHSLTLVGPFLKATVQSGREGCGVQG